MSLTKKIKEFALDIGYSKVGIIPADSFSDYLADISNRSEMYSFFLKGASRAADPRSQMPTAKSIITTVYDYSQKNFPQELTDKIARIYQARCYNAPPDRIHGARPQLLRRFLENAGCEVGIGTIVPERIAAAKAGIVNFGRNNFAYANGIGSFIYLTSFLVDQELEYDAPTLEVGCPEGCRACIKACPTQAIYEPQKLNPLRCIAYNNFFRQDEMPGGSFVPYDIREKIGTKIHGCDICQEVCPRNRKKVTAQKADDEYLTQIAKDYTLTNFLHMTDDFYQTRVQPLMHNYIKHKKYFQRNAAIALGNLADPAAIPDLALAMADTEELVREYAAWALGKIGSNPAKQVLEVSLASEVSPAVQREITAALLAM
ncbi:epoxyqueuosine reductase [Pelosinus propionicus]|uniref:Epoxyqueuosine reductase n=1 Tax=Pelosinus propionicus DSM 13327 TaxID=1123291 RepID=A0A1I4NXD9_9FIRM|nr:4Fe-4S double cluster binding domain-containing protein [Pelosinus propionicus]SFM20056.1 epoxyqueuosine reductase [Pelosinus propionicus DSM 13327]